MMDPRGGGQIDKIKEMEGDIMARKEPTRELKIKKIHDHLDALAEAENLPEEYIDDLLAIVQQYHQMIDRAERK